MELTTRYMGLSLPCPVVAGASPMSEDVKNVEALAAAFERANYMKTLGSCAPD